MYQLASRKFGNFNTLANFHVLPGYDLEDFVKAGRAVIHFNHKLHW